MAQFIEHGGTNGVPVLDLGLPGGSLQAEWPEGGAYSTIQLYEGQVTAPREESAMPQQNLVAVQHGGFHGRIITATGTINAIDHTTLNYIIGEIRKREFDPVLQRPTFLRRNDTDQSWKEVVIRNFRTTTPRERASGGPQEGTVLVGYEFEFHALRDEVEL